MASKKVRIAPKYSPLTVGEAELVVRTNVPARVIADLDSGNTQRIIDAITAIVKEHSWVGEDDKSLAVADLPFETYGEIAEAYGKLLNALPKP